MPTNLSMFQGALAQPTSIAEYANEFGQIQNNALARKQAQMQIDAATRAAQQDDTYNQLAKGFGADIQSNVNALRQGGLGARADTYLKAAQEAQEKAAKTSKDIADTDTTKYKLQRSKYENGISVLVGSQTPEDAIARINKGVADGAWSMQEAQQKIREIPQDPNQFQDWRMRELLGVVSAKDQLEHALKQQEFSLKANNELIGPDGKVNLALLGAKQKVAKAGASNTNVNVNTDKTLTSTMAKGLGDQLDASLAGAQAATNTIGTAKQIRDLVSSGKVITGPGADYRVTLARIGDLLGVSGADNQEKLSNTAALVQNLAKTELDSAQSMKGQGQITEAERAILKKAAGGDLNMSAPELIALSNAMDKTARSRISSHQSKVEKLRSVPGAEPLIPFYSVETPDQQPAANGAVKRYNPQTGRIE